MGRVVSIFIVEGEDEQTTRAHLLGCAGRHKLHDTQDLVSEALLLQTQHHHVRLLQHLAPGSDVLRAGEGLNKRRGGVGTKACHRKFGGQQVSHARTGVRGERRHEGGRHPRERALQRVGVDGQVGCCCEPFEDVVVVLLRFLGSARSAEEVRGGEGDQRRKGSSTAVL